MLPRKRCSCVHVGRRYVRFSLCRRIRMRPFYFCLLTSPVVYFFYQKKIALASQSQCYFWETRLSTRHVHIWTCPVKPFSKKKLIFWTEDRGRSVQIVCLNTCLTAWSAPSSTRTLDTASIKLLGSWFAHRDMDARSLPSNTSNVMIP